MIDLVGSLAFGSVCGWLCVLVGYAGLRSPSLWKSLIFAALLWAGALAVGQAFGQWPGLAATALGLAAGAGAAFAIRLGLWRRLAGHQDDGIMQQTTG